MSSNVIPFIPRRKVVPIQKPGKSVQDVETPADFIAAVEKRFGKLAFDLAALSTNTKVPGHFFAPQIDSLAQDWSKLSATLPVKGNMWLNPPYGSIEPWVEKCAGWGASQRRFRIGKNRGLLLLLVPASIGARWFEAHVHKQALVLGLVGRLTFVGHTQSYPKDLILCVYGGDVGFDLWDWRKDR